MPQHSRRAFLKGLGALGAGAFALRLWAQDAPAPQTYVVEMRDFFYDPPGLVLRREDRVIWVEVEDALGDGHTATAFHPDFDKVRRVPEAAPPWNSGFLFEPGQSWERRFEAIGVHDYFCIPHEDRGMVGRLLVEEATGPGTQPLAVGLSSASRSVMPTLDELFGPPGEVFNFEGQLNGVVLALRHERPERALERWAALRARVPAALPQLWASLSEAEQRALLAELDALGRALKADPSPSAVQGAVEALKVHLEQLAFA